MKIWFLILLSLISVACSAAGSTKVRQEGDSSTSVQHKQSEEIGSIIDEIELSFKTYCVRKDQYERNSARRGAELSSLIKKFLALKRHPGLRFKRKQKPTGYDIDDFIDGSKKAISHSEFIIKVLGQDLKESELLLDSLVELIAKIEEGVESETRLEPKGKDGLVDSLTELLEKMRKDLKTVQRTISETKLYRDKTNKWVLMLSKQLKEVEVLPRDY